MSSPTLVLSNNAQQSSLMKQDYQQSSVVASPPPPPPSSTANEFDHSHLPFYTIHQPIQMMPYHHHQQQSPPIAPIQSNLAASLAAVKSSSASLLNMESSHHAMLTVDNHLTAEALQRQSSVPSSCGSTISPISSSPTSPSLSHHSPTSSVAEMHRISPFEPLASHQQHMHPNHSHTVHSHQHEPLCPISLWYGCEDSDHARAVISAYSAALNVITCVTQRPANSRAPLEFIGRVKREKLDIPKLHRLVDHYLRQQIMQRRHTQPTRQRQFDFSSSLDFSPSLSSSPTSTSSHLPSSSSSDPLHQLPSKNSFSTLDLVSIYSRDTLPLGLVFPLIRHEWLVTVWNVADGIPESFVRIHTEYEEFEEDEEEEAEDDEEDESRKALELYLRAVVRQPKSVSAKTSPNGSPQITPSLVHSNSAHSSLWHDGASTVTNTSTLNHQASASSSSIASTNSSESSSSLTSTSSSSSSSPSCSTSYLYNLPIFSAECESSGAFDCFGCKVVRPLGDKQLGVKKMKTNKKKLSKNLESPPSTLGYSGSQNDCVYNALQAFGRKVRCNGASESESCERMCEVTDVEAEMRACVESQTNDNHDESKQDEEVDDDELSNQDESELSDEDDEEDLDHEEDDDEVEEEEVEEDHSVTHTTGFEFDHSDAASDDDQDTSLPTITYSNRPTSQAVAIRKSPLRQTTIHHDDDDDDDHHSFSHSFSSTHASFTPGSLGNELAEQLRSLGLKK